MGDIPARKRERERARARERERERKSIAILSGNAEDSADSDESSSGPYRERMELLFRHPLKGEVARFIEKISKGEIR